MTSPVVQPPSTIPDLGSSPVNITNTFFFETISEQCWQDCIADFIDATGADAMASSICTICAGSFFHSEMDFVSLASLHESGLLVPLTSHPAHILMDGMLLHRNPSCFSLDIAGHSRATVCWPCLSSLNCKKNPCFVSRKRLVGWRYSNHSAHTHASWACTRCKIFSCGVHHQTISCEEGRLCLALFWLTQWSSWECFHLLFKHGGHCKNDGFTDHATIPHNSCCHHQRHLCRPTKYTWQNHARFFVGEPLLHTWGIVMVEGKQSNLPKHRCVDWSIKWITPRWCSTRDYVSHETFRWLCAVCPWERWICAWWWRWIQKWLSGHQPYGPLCQCKPVLNSFPHRRCLFWTCCRQCWIFICFCRWESRRICNTSSSTGCGGCCGEWRSW